MKSTDASQQVRLRYPGNDAIQRKLSIIDEEDSKLSAWPTRHDRSTPCQWCSCPSLRTGQTDLLPEFAELDREILQCHQRSHTPSLGRPTTPNCPLYWMSMSERPDSNMNLRKLEERQNDSGFLEQWGSTKLSVKRKLSSYIHRNMGVLVDPSSLFDVQVKRIHEYKRQHLNALQVITQYLRIKNGQDDGMAPRTVIFGGKAAPGYYMAKLIIRFINGIAETINADPDMDGRLRVVFLPDYNVKLGEQVYPPPTLRTDFHRRQGSVSTENMKFAIPVLTIGTLDGANEIRDLVGAETSSYSAKQWIRFKP